MYLFFNPSKTLQKNKDFGKRTGHCPFHPFAASKRFPLYWLAAIGGGRGGGGGGVFQLFRETPSTSESLLFLFPIVFQPPPLSQFCLFSEKKLKWNEFLLFQSQSLVTVRSIPTLSWYLSIEKKKLFFLSFFCLETPWRNKLSSLGIFYAAGECKLAVCNIKRSHPQALSLKEAIIWLRKCNDLRKVFFLLQRAKNVPAKKKFLKNVKNSSATSSAEPKGFLSWKWCIHILTQLYITV